MIARPSRLPIPAWLKSGERMPLWLLTFLFSLPILVAVIYRLATGYWWWRDFDAVLCGGLQALHRLPIYSAHPSCPGLTASDYIYPPQVAWLTAQVEAHVGLGTLRAIFTVLQIAVCLWLGWLMLGRRLQHIGVRQRIPALGLVAGGVIACGNVAILCHALAAASLLTAKRTRLPFIAAVALICIIKPTYAVYLVVLLLDKAPWRDRLIRGALGVAALAAVGVAIWSTGGPDLVAWQDALHRVLKPDNLGGGLLRMFSNLGLPTQGLVPSAAFVVFAVLMTVSGIAIVEARGGAFAADERWLFAIGLAQLVTPRPMGYDLLVLAPAIAMIGIAAGDVSEAFGKRIRGVLLAVCIIACAMGAVFLGGHAVAWTPAILAVAVLSVGLTLAWRRLRAGVPAWAAAAKEEPAV